MVIVLRVERVVRVVRRSLWGVISICGILIAAGIKNRLEAYSSTAVRFVLIFSTSCH